MKEGGQEAMALNDGQYPEEDKIGLRAIARAMRSFSLRPSDLRTIMSNSGIRALIFLFIGG
jgi:hypothetical protein